MKIVVNVSLLAFLVVTISACEHHVSMETTVHESGAVDKIIVLETEDTTKNFLGIGLENGWKVTAKPIEQDTSSEKKTKVKKWSVQYEKSFTSAQQATEELAMPSDSLFRVSSKFERSFRWFYTYIKYSDTYHAINRLSYPLDDYLTQEDFTFIDRLPAENNEISKADSLYLSRLQEKIFDVYGLRALYESYYTMNETLISESGLEDRWIDTLKKHKEHLFHQLAEKKDLPEDFIYEALDSLGIPFPYDKMKNRYHELNQRNDAITSFINHASEGKYTHIINMPWHVVHTNADSVSDKRLLWNPPSIKFLLSDYTMYAESRKLNLWAIIVSVAVVMFSAYLFWRKKNSI
jgi:hypothetical protein